MNVEYTGRQYEIIPAIRKQVETGLTKIKKILGDKFDTKVILAVEKHRHKAEITVSPRKGPIVGLAQAGDMLSAVNEALEHLEKQTVKYKTRWRTKKRQPRKGWDGEGKEVARQAAVGTTGTIAVPIVARKFLQVSRTTEAHLVRSTESVALRPLTLEEAIKEAQFRDRDVFVFRDPEGSVMVLHRTREGKMELIEAP
ncbi:MAG: ribosome-associated translation inhibitor RaiA [Acidobacteria bacterium]|nr:MAG: ribosome-associated translation inhibitor RaiA [Acidobacteriota bacterium]